MPDVRAWRPTQSERRSSCCAAQIQSRCRPRSRATTPTPSLPAVAQDQFDSLDLSDNEIRKLECMAVLPRVKLLMFNNNQLNRCVAAPPPPLPPCALLGTLASCNLANHWA